jgi:asparagine synthase (glutamine-hydrolysing)
LEKTRDVGDGACFQNAPGNSLLRRLLHFDQSSWLPDNLLERGDRMSMAASIEGRLPFMDHRLAEYVSALPDNYRVRGRTTKWILRQAMQRLLPAEILNRPKVGFRVPVNDWFRGPLKDWIRELLLESGSKTTGYYHKKRLEKVINDHTRGRHNHEKLLWTMLNLELVHREYSL